ncbi:MAG: SAM-dependent chlorinase/fluorinase [Flavobacteriales bacterium]|nr:SAM-dependent chlorinase/fluorinase [Flavobacteriales bacterium]
MSIITLTTDMGLRDHYVATVKGAIWTQYPEARIVDISHGIKPFDSGQAAFVLRQAYPEFPRGTIHIIGVNPEADGHTPHLVVRHDGHYFIGADNGIFSLLFDGMPHEAFELTMKLDHDHVAFPARSVFAKAACHLARGGTVDVIGRKVTQVKELIGFLPAADTMSIRGRVIYIDSYGNLMTNVRKKLFDEVGRGRGFRISFGHREDDIVKIHGTYGDVVQGERLAFFNATGLLEIAVNKAVEGSGGGAARLFGVKLDDTVRIDFQERGRN